MAGMRRISVSLAQKTVQSIRLFGLLVAQLCAYSMLSALCFACPLYLFDCSGSSTLYGAVAAIAFVPGVLATPAGGILADRGRHRGVLVVLGIVLMAASLLFIPMKRSLPLAVVVAAMLISTLFKVIPFLSEVSSGFVIIITTLIVAGAAAYFCPIEDEKEEESVHES